MQCPSCRSDNVQRLRLIYEAGTSDISTTSHTSGVGYSYGGGFATGLARTDTIGTQKTRAAQRAAPPAKRAYSPLVYCLLISIAVFYFKPSHYIAPGWTYVALAILALGLWRGFKAYQYNTQSWPEKYEDWKRKWFCNKCGEIYIH